MLAYLSKAQWGRCCQLVLSCSLCFLVVAGFCCCFLRLVSLSPGYTLDSSWFSCLHWGLGFQTSAFTPLDFPFSNFQTNSISHFPGSDVLAEPGVCSRIRLSALVWLLLTWYQTSEDPEAEDSNILRELAAQIIRGSAEEKKTLQIFYLILMGPTYLRHRGKKLFYPDSDPDIWELIFTTLIRGIKKFIHLFIYYFMWCACVSMHPSRVAFVGVSVRGQLMRIRFLLSLWGTGDSGPQAWKQAPLSRWPLGDNCRQVYCYSLYFSFFLQTLKTPEDIWVIKILTSPMYPNILILKKVKFRLLLVTVLCLCSWCFVKMCSHNSHCYVHIYITSCLGLMYWNTQTHTHMWCGWLHIEYWCYSVLL